MLAPAATVRSRVAAGGSGGTDGHVEAVEEEGGPQCSTLTGITFLNNQTCSWLTSQNNQKVVLTEPREPPAAPRLALGGQSKGCQLCQASVALSDPGRALRQPHAHFAGWAAWSWRRPEAGRGRSGGLGRALGSLRA